MRIFSLVDSPCSWIRKFHAALASLHLPGPVFKNNDEGGDNYEVEYIGDHRDIAHGREYYIHWKGWPSSDNEWIHEDDMDSPDLIMEYLSSISTQTSMHRTKGRRGARAECDSDGSRGNSNNP